MDYEKKYKEANDKIAARFGINVAKEIFTDLYESEDERIRKEIMDFIDTNTIDSDERRNRWFSWLEKQKEPELSEDLGEYIAELSKQFPEVSFAKLSRIAVRVKNWLEKQGEKKSFDYKNQNTQNGHKFNIGDIISNGKVEFRVDNIVKNYIGQDCYFLVNIKSEKNGMRYFTIRDSEGNTHNAGETTWICEQVDAKFEKQGEQKSTDKVEPKFHEGDWVVQENIGTYKVIEVCESWYEVIDDQDNRYSIGFDKEYMCHLWTIQDAKDGDVLYYKSDCGVEFIVMSKGVNKSNNIDSYFRYNSNDGFGIDIPSVLSAKQDNITPATKEQRDTLMKAMTDAGWEFDFEKKELKKIEKKSDEYSNTERQEMFIKSQRPHFWRPSDEQMEALKGVQEGVFRLGILESLYNDLKKLKT